MKTAGELIERLTTDGAFAEKAISAVKAKLDAGNSDLKEVIIQTAEEFGYAVTAEDLASAKKALIGYL